MTGAIDFQLHEERSLPRFLLRSLLLFVVAAAAVVIYLLEEVGLVGLVGIAAGGDALIIVWFAVTKDLSR
jgi:hypothetical protein